MSRNLAIIICLVLTFIIIISCGKKERIIKATITSLTGKVEVQQANEINWQAAQEKMELSSKDRIRTHPASTCEIMFEDETIVKVDDNTILQLGVPSERKYGKEKGLIPDIKLLLGRIWCRIKKLPAKEKEFYIETPAAIAGIHGSLFSTKVNINGDTLISVREGKLEVFGEETSVIVEAGYQTEISIEKMEPEHPILMTMWEEEKWQKIEKWMKEIKEEAEEVANVHIVAAKSALSALRMPLEFYKEDYGNYPETLTLDTLEELSEFIDTKPILKSFHQNRLVSYKRTYDGYEIRARAKDRDNTLVIATPDEITTE